MNDHNTGNQQDDTLLKPRSYRGVLAAGVRMYTGRFRLFFKASWLMALLYALVCGAVGTLVAIKIPETTMALAQQLTDEQGVLVETARQYLITSGVLLLLVVAALAALTLASATIVNKLKEHRETGAISVPSSWLTPSRRLMGRTLKGVFLTLFIGVLPFVLAAAAIALAEGLSPQFIARHPVTIGCTLVLVTLLVLALTLPLAYVLMKYLLEAPARYWHTLRQGYAVALRHWGTSFLVFFVSLLLVQLAALVVMLPSHILTFANQAAQTGLLMGDPLGMPSYMGPLTFCTFALTCFIQFYVSQVTLLHNYYLYGSIEAKELERQQQH